MNQSTPPTKRTRRFRLHRRYTPVVFAFYMAGIMALLMCAVIVGFNQGITEDFLARVIRAYVVAMPVAFACVLFVRPLVMKLVGLTIDQST